MDRSITFTQEIKVSPWDALIGEVRQSAGRAAWIDARVAVEIKRLEDFEASDDYDGDEDKRERARQALARELREWIKLSREERAHKTSVATSAVRAGLSERYIESVQAEAHMIASVLQRALQAADLGPEQWLAATDELRVALADVGRELNARHASVGPHIRERPAIEG